MATDFATPVGRLVQGAVLQLRPVLDDNGKQKLNDQGQPVPDQVYIAIAVTKTPGVTKWWMEPPIRNADGTMNSFWQDVYRAGQTAHPGFFNAQNGECINPNFAWKITDGDGFDKYGKSNAGKEGFAGCWIIKFGGQYLPKLIHNGAYIDNAKYVKLGDFIRVFGTATGNTGKTPGIYMNPNGVEFLAYGQEIKSGPDVLAMAAKFGGVAALPAGASLTPLASANPGLPAPGGLPTPGVMPGAVMQQPQQPMPGVLPLPAQPAAPAVAAPAMAMPGQPQPMAMPGAVAPNHAFVQNAMAGAMPTPGAMPQPVMQAQPVYSMTAAAQGYSKEQYNAQGYTDEVLIANGFMVRTA